MGCFCRLSVFIGFWAYENVSGQVIGGRISRPLYLSDLQTLVRLGYLEGQEDLVSRLTMGIIRVTICVVAFIDLLAKFPWPSILNPEP